MKPLSIYGRGSSRKALFNDFKHIERRDTNSDKALEIDIFYGAFGNFDAKVFLDKLESIKNIYGFNEIQIYLKNEDQDGKLIKAKDITIDFIYSYLRK